MSIRIHTRKYKKTTKTELQKTRTKEDFKHNQKQKTKLALQ